VQAHLYEADALELACLKFAKKNFQLLVVSASYGKLMRDWPAVALKIQLHMAGTTTTTAKPALHALAHDGEDNATGESSAAGEVEATKSEGEDASGTGGAAAGAKRKRRDDDGRNGGGVARG
jgi:hypothetical protein